MLVAIDLATAKLVSFLDTPWNSWLALYAEA